MDARHAASSLCHRSAVVALLLLLLLLRRRRSSSLVQAAGPYLDAAYVNCLRNTSSLSDPFARNLNTALSNLTALSSRGTTYATTTAGQEDMVYAVFQCRGDQSKQLCWECMQNATARLPKKDCPASVGARIQLDGCFLRYDNQSFFVLDMTTVFHNCYPNTSDSVALGAIQGLMANVTSMAPKQGGFASASGSFEFAVAQCLGYLNESQCSQCLSRYSYRTVCDSNLGGQLHLASCYYRYEPQPFFESSPSPPPALGSPRSSPQEMSSAPPPPESQASSKTAIVAGVVVAGVTASVVGVCAILVWRRKASRIKGEPKGQRLKDESRSWPNLLQNKAKVFSLLELQQATSNFHPSNKVGEGAFGTVYKGILLDGEQVAIKKLNIGRQEGKLDFLNEVNLITSVQHKNLIRLLGCCVEDSERILVYEYLPKKSLDFFLYGEARENITLSWPTRYCIIVGMAKGLSYLHEGSHVRIIHRDIKPSNILLDDELNPVIADFGLARLVKDNATLVNTRVAGTVGYLAPEYAIRGDLSTNADVYSFGVVCLEIITGKQNVNSRLLTWVWEKYRNGRPVDLVDENLGDAFSPEQFTRVVHVALLCTQQNPKQRPTMSRVILWLSGTSNILEIPTRPTFLDYSKSKGEISKPFTSTSSTFSQSTHMDNSEVSMISGGLLSLTEITNPR